MRYRQWKKNYKKKWGHNPGVLLDKRLRRRQSNSFSRKLFTVGQILKNTRRYANYVMRQKSEKGE